MCFILFPDGAVFHHRTWIELETIGLIRESIFMNLWMKVFVVIPFLNQVSPFEFFFPEFLKQFSIYDWVLPQKQQNEGIFVEFSVPMQYFL